MTNLVSGERETESLLRSCCRRVFGKGARKGTGFFIGPNLVLTCAHVLEGLDVGSEVKIAKIDEDSSSDFSIATIVARDNDGDLAVLMSSTTESLYAPLDERLCDEDKVVGFGFLWPTETRTELKKYIADVEGQNDFNENGRIGIEWQLKGSHIEPGFSGGPVLNIRTHAVAGVMQATRSRNSALGGFIIPVSYALKILEKIGQTHLPPVPAWQSAIVSDLRATYRNTQPKPIWLEGRPEYSFAALNLEVERLFAEGEVVESFDVTRRIVKLAMNDMLQHGGDDYSRMGLGNMLVNGIRSSSYLRDRGVTLIDFLSKEVSNAIKAEFLTPLDATAIRLELLAVNQGYRNYSLVALLLNEFESSPTLDGIMRLKLNSRRLLAGFIHGSVLDDTTVKSLAGSNEGDSKHAVRFPLVRAWGALARGDVDFAEGLIVETVRKMDTRNSAPVRGNYDAILELEVRLTFKSMRREVDPSLHRKNDRAISKLYNRFDSRPIALRPLVFDLISGRTDAMLNPATLSYQKYFGDLTVSDVTRHMLEGITRSIFQSLR